MQVLTLNKDTFEEHATQLAKIVESDLPSDGFDAIIGVMRGGAIVCDAFCRHFPSSAYRLRTDVMLQRPSTKRKNGTIAKILKIFPLRVLDFMRIAESRVLSLKRSWTSKQPPAVSLSEELSNILKGLKPPKILIIDDAIDSGTTIYAIRQTLQVANPEVDVKVAVITVTTTAPRIKADYALYRNQTLIRFPWSNDSR